MELGWITDLPLLAVGGYLWLSLVLRPTRAFRRGVLPSADDRVELADGFHATFAGGPDAEGFLWFEAGFGRILAARRAAVARVRTPVCLPGDGRGGSLGGD